MPSATMPQSTPALLTAPSAGGRKQSVRAGIWHFVGPVVYHHFSATSCSVHFDLTLNPTRFAEHCGRLFNPTTIEDLQQVSLPALLSVRQDNVLSIRSGTLDNSDNMISSSRWLSYVSQHWSSFVDFYASSVRCLIENLYNEQISCVNDVGVPPMLRIDLPTGSSLNIGYVEQHVEFRVHDAIREIDRITGWLCCATSDVSEVLPPNRMYRGRENSATWVAMHLRSSVKLTCYAKEEGRIRVEIAYGGRSAHGRSIGTLIAGGRWPGRGTPREKVEALQADAARRIDRVMSSLRHAPADGHRRPDEVFSELVNVLASGRYDAPAAWEFLKSLLSDGSARGRRDSRKAKIGEAMVRKGIMVRSTISGRGRFQYFIPNEGLSEALSRLRSERTP